MGEGGREDGGRMGGTEKDKRELWTQTLISRSIDKISA